MKKTFVLLSSLLMAFSLSGQVDARVADVSVLKHKNGNSINIYVKNHNNKSINSVAIQLIKNGKVVNSKSVTLKGNQQAVEVFKASGKGKYKVKYTSSGKSSYSNFEIR